MSTVQAVYQALQENRSYPQEVYLEDLIDKGCGFRHYLQLLGTEPTEPEPGPDILLREAGYNLRAMVQRYLRKAFPDTFKVGTTNMLHDVVVVSNIGVWENAFVEVVPTPTGLFQNGGMTKRARLITAAKAWLAGMDRAWVILLDRDKLDWSSWTLRGDFEAVGEIVAQEAQFIHGLLDGTSHRMGTAGETTCRRCPFNNACDATLMDDPEPFGENLVMKLEPRLVKELEKYLWSKNERFRFKGDKRISPSHFAVTECDRAVAYGLMGTKQRENHDPKLRRIFDAGYAFHDVVQNALQWAFPDFKEEVKVWLKQYRVRGSCDGLLPDHGFEIKSIGSKGFETLRSPKKDHKKQATLYGVGLDVSKVEYLYVNKETGELRSFLQPPSKQQWHAMAGRAERIIQIVDDYLQGKAELPDRIDNEYQCRKCKFGWICRPELFRRKEQAAVQGRIRAR